MNVSHTDLRRAFAAPTPLFVRISREGFIIDDQPVTEIVGRVRSTRLLRRVWISHGLRAPCDFAAVGSCEVGPES